MTKARTLISSYGLLSPSRSGQEPSLTEVLPEQGAPLLERRPIARSAAQQIRVLNLLTNFHIGGTERQVTNIALKLDASRFDLHLACLRNSGELLEELKSLDVPRPEFCI